MKRNKIYKYFFIFFLTYLLFGAFFIYASRTVPCGEVCTPERPLINPLLHKIATVPAFILIVPLLPIFKLVMVDLLHIETTKGAGIIIVYLFGYLIWLFYFSIIAGIYLFLKKRRKKN